MVWPFRPNLTSMSSSILPAAPVIHSFIRGFSSRATSQWIQTSLLTPSPPPPPGWSSPPCPTTLRPCSRVTCWRPSRTRWRWRAWTQMRCGCWCSTPTQVPIHADLWQFGDGSDQPGELRYVAHYNLLFVQSKKETFSPLCFSFLLCLLCLSSLISSSPLSSSPPLLFCLLLSLSCLRQPAVLKDTMIF